MKLYRPVLIESAEQAEALPVGTVVQRIVPVDVGKPEPYAGVKFARNTWFTTSTTLDLRDALDRHMIGWTALVPIEAEEEWDVVGDAAVGHRYVTPWEEA